MIDRRSWMATLLLALSPLPALGAEAPHRLDDELEQTRAKYGLPALAAAVVVRGVIVGAGVAGVRIIGTDFKARIDDRFHLGSDTKAMTSLLAGMMIEEGKLDWTSTIGGVLAIRDMNPALAAVTLEQLLSHSSGIPTDTDEIIKLYFNADAFDSQPAALRLKMIEAWKAHAPVTPPGTAFHYANLGYITAGAMIETVAGAPWEQLITERIFAPLGLASAGLGPQATRGRIDAAIGHKVEDSGAVSPMPWGEAADAPSSVGPAGVAHMSVSDFAAWAGWNAGGGRRGPALVKPETLARIHRPHVSTGKLPDAPPGTPDEGQYCLGWGQVKFAWTPAPVLSHNGSNGMNFAKILVDRDQDIGVVVLINFPGKKPDAAAGEVVEALYRRHAKTT
jgi:CubicO group peptidase (beta-lactamase class C family)